MEKDLEKLYDTYRKVLNESEKNYTQRIKKGDEVPVKLMFLAGQPVSKVTAENDSEYNEYSKTESFSFLFGGDMMMFAKWNGEKWISD